MKRILAHDAIIVSLAALLVWLSTALRESSHESLSGPSSAGDLTSSPLDGAAGSPRSTDDVHREQHTAAK